MVAAGPVARWRATGAALVLVALLVAALARVGADLEWLVAMGDHIRATGRVPDGVPFAEAPTAGWPNVLVVSEVALSLVHASGSGALLAWHVVLCVLALGWLALDARRRGAGDVATSVVLVLVVVGGVATFGVARLQSWSLLAFVALLVLLRSQHVRRDATIWWVVPLVALWGNLHGAVLLGVCVLGAHLLFSRLRPRPVETVLVGVSSLAALWLTPALARTGDYYLGVLGNESAVRKEGLWAPLTVSDPVDAVLVVVVLVLAVLALRRRLPLWEYVALAGLAGATVMGSRHGVWLLLALAVPAAIGGGGAPSGTAPVQRSPRASVLTAATVALAVSCAALAAHRGAADAAVQERLALAVAERVEGGVVLAPGVEAETLAVQGVRLWASNPVDAFERVDQRAYLDFLDGGSGMGRAVEGSDAVLAKAGSATSDAMDADGEFERTDLGSGWLLYLRTAAGS